MRYWEPAEWLAALVAVPAAQPVAVDWVVPVSAASAPFLFARAAAAFPVPLLLAAAAFPAPPVPVVASAPVLFARAAAAFPVPPLLAPALAHGRRPVSGH